MSGTKEWLIGKGVLVLLTTYSHGWARRGSSHVSMRPPWSTRAYQTPSGTSAGASSRQSITKPFTSQQTILTTIYNYEMSTVCLLDVLSLRRDIVLKAVGPRVRAPRSLTTDATHVRHAPSSPRNCQPTIFKIDCLAPPSTPKAGRHCLWFYRNFLNVKHKKWLGSVVFFYCCSLVTVCLRASTWLTLLIHTSTSHSAY